MDRTVLLSRMRRLHNYSNILPGGYTISSKGEDKKKYPAIVHVMDTIGGYGISAKEFIRDLQDVENDEIELHVNSPGGVVFEGIAIYNALKDHPAHVTAIVDGAAYSAASFIVQAADKRVMNRQSEMMVHEAQGFLDALVMGNAEDIKKALAEGDKLLDRLDKASNNIAEIYSARAGGTVESWRAVMSEDTFYTPEEAVEAGLADEFVASETNAITSPPVTAEGTTEEVPEPTFDVVGLREALKGVFA